MAGPALAPTALGPVEQTAGGGTIQGSSAGSVFTPPPVPTTPAPTTKTTTTPTVLSNANIIENTIPQLNQRAASLTTDEPTTIAPQAPVVPTPSVPAPGIPPASDPSQSTDPATLYNYELGQLPDPTQDPTYQSDLDLINSLQDQGDATTSAYVNSIQQNYLGLTSTLQAQQKANLAKTSNALLLGGSSRYAPVSSGGIIDMATRGDMNALATLQDQENQKIAEVKQAQNSQDFNLMSKKMSELDTITANKQKLAQTLATNLQKQNQTAQIAMVQNQQDNAIADLVSSGTTDPNNILSALTKQGFTTATAKDVATTLEGIQKATGTKSLTALSGNIGAFYTLKAAGQLPAGISSLPDDQQLFAFLSADKSATTKPSTKTSSGTNGKTIVSGTLSYTPADFASDSSKLNNSKGADGFVDPTIYQNLYDAWVGAGGSITDFLKTFPSKDYVNPANNTLPTYLRSSTKSGSAAPADANPFG